MFVRSFHRAVVLTAGTVFVVASLFACGSTSSTPRDTDYRTVAADLRRDTERARELNNKAADAIDAGNLDKAEELLMDALNTDVMFGPAHNNLGLLYYHQRKLYLAAWEFQYAAKLMPHQAQPKNNLGLVFEAADEFDKAIAHYDEALQLEPHNPELIGNAARARIKRGDRDGRLHELLDELVLKDTRPQWVEWAREQRALLREVEQP